MIKSIIATAALVAAFFMPAWAAPPEGMIQKMAPIHMMCLQADVDPHHLSTLMGALITDYGVWVAETWSTDAAKTMRIVYIINDRTGMVGVLLNTDYETCIAFSGQDRQVFVMPDDHPVGKLNEDQKT